jgi:hypothetical protein
MKRRFLGRYNNLITRHAIYATDNAIEIDEQDNFEIVRKRVFFDDVLLVTQHDRTGILGIFVSLSFAGFLILIGTIAGGRAGWIFGSLGIPVAIYGLIRIRVKESIITVFGQRSKARIRFMLRRARAQRLYDEICERVRHAQSQPQEEATAHDLDQDSTVREG